MPAKEKLDLSQLDFSTFIKTIDKSYRCAEQKNCELLLTEVVKLSQPNDPRVKRVPFVLVFKAPRHFPNQQAIYQLINQEIGHLELFLVPVSSSEQNVTLEATFT